MDLFWQLPDAVSYAIGSHGKTTLTDTHINIIYHITDVGTIEGFSQIFWITFFYDTAKLRSLYLISIRARPSPPLSPQFPESLSETPVTMSHI